VTGTSRPTSADLSAAFALIRDIPDFPEPGVLFRDIGPLLADASAFRAVVDALADTVPADVDLVVALEARGFLLGAAVGYARNLGVVAVRKPGKLPLVAHRVDYALEYGSATFELSDQVVAPGQRVVVVDDVLATGGTVRAACELVEHVGGEVAGVSVVLELAGLAGRDRLAGRDVRTLLTV
jgi:adenine phosphoribosyltransferase